MRTLTFLLLASFPFLASAQAPDGDATSVSFFFAKGRSSLDVESGTGVTFSSKGLTHLGLRVERRLSPSMMARASIGRSVRDSEYEESDASSRARFGMRFLLTDAQVGIGRRVSEHKLWTLHVLGEVGRSFIQWGRISDPATRIEFAELETNPGEWSLIPGAELAVLPSRRLSFGVSYRYGLTDVLQGDRSRSRVLELRSGFTFLRF